MHLSRIYPSGAEEWDCPACGRRQIILWQPEYKRIVLEYGNLDVMHSSSKSGTCVISPRICADEEAGLPDAIRSALEEALGDDDAEDDAERGGPRA